MRKIKTIPVEICSSKYNSGKRLGAGGMMFICMSLILAAIMIFTIRVNWISTSSNTAREIAQIASMSVAATEYSSGTSSYSRTVGIGDYLGQQSHRYPVVDEVRRMASDSGIADSHGIGEITYVHVTWDKSAKKATVVIPSYRSFFNTRINSVTQSAVIEFNN